MEEWINTLCHTMENLFNSEKEEILSLCQKMDETG
jgi:hypothetical protein